MEVKEISNKQINLFGIAYAILLFLHPVAAIFLFFSATAIFNVRITKGILILFAINLASLVATRYIPAIPADDLSQYFIFYEYSKANSFIELFFYSRFEPVLFYVYKLLPFGLSAANLLFINSFLATVFFVFATNALSSIIDKENNYKMFVWPLFLCFFPFELISNVPRQMLAIGIFFYALTSKRRNFFIIVALLTHKIMLPALFIYILIKAKKKILIGVLGILFLYLLMIFFPQIIIELFFSRIDYFVYREGQFSFFPIVVFFAAAFGLIFLNRGYRDDIYFTLLISILSIFTMQFGPLGARLIYLAWPFFLIILIGLFAKFIFVQRRIIVLPYFFIFLILFSWRIFFPDEYSHDVLSGFDIMQVFFNNHILNFI